MSDPLMILPPQSLRSQEIARARKLKRGMYADTPGTGPAGETCKSCQHIYRKHMGKTYLKCALTRAWWTGGGGTDIKAGSSACSKWEAQPPQPEAKRAHPKSEGR